LPKHFISLFSENVFSWMSVKANFTWGVEAVYSLSSIYMGSKRMKSPNLFIFDILMSDSNRDIRNMN
jgi:hypothetical protein